MRRKEREITDSEKIEAILSEAKYLHLGMLDDGYPYVVPLHYGYTFIDGKLTFYIHCAKEGHKLDLIGKNGNVFVQIDCGQELVEGNTACMYGARFASVMGRGKASAVNDPKEKCEALAILMKTQTGSEHTIAEKMADTVAVIKIEMESFTAKARTE